MWRYSVNVARQNLWTAQPGTLAVSGLTPATYYTVRVTARDLAGNVSVATSLTFRTKALPTTADSTPPATPTALTARAGSTALTVTWPPVTDNVGVVGYRVTVGGALHEVPAPSLSVEGLTPGTPYAVQVVAVDAAGNPSPPATLNLETRPAPAARGLVGNIAWFGTGTTRASMDEALASPLIDGISVFARWSDVTTDGVAFNFGVFDTARAAAGAAGKPWNGMLVYGVRDNGMPEYVLAGLPPGEVLTISGETFPAFWSASAQAAARDLVTRAATRYGDDPNLVQWRVTGLWATNGEPWFQGGPTGRATWLATYQLDHPGASFEDLVRHPRDPGEPDDRPIQWCRCGSRSAGLWRLAAGGLRTRRTLPGTDRCPADRWGVIGCATDRADLPGDDPVVDGARQLLQRVLRQRCPVCRARPERRGAPPARHPGAVSIGVDPVS
ncbi:MAG: fibronectin type III domain-containing protein [Nostocoides sp.]